MPDLERAHLCVASRQALHNSQAGTPSVESLELRLGCEFCANLEAVDHREQEIQDDTSVRIVLWIASSSWTNDGQESAPGS